MKKSALLSVLFLAMACTSQTSRFPSAEAPLYVNATASLGLPTDMRGLLTLVHDLNDDHYPDVIFMNHDAVPTQLNVYINENGARFKKVEVVGIKLKDLAHVKFARGLLEKNVLSAAVRTLNGKPEVRNLEFYNVQFTNNQLVFSLQPQKIIINQNIGDYHFIDYDRDGDLDIVAGMFYSNTPSQSYEADSLRLFKSQPQQFKFGKGLINRVLGRKKAVKVMNNFVDASAEVGLLTRPGHNLGDINAPTPTLAMAVCDINGDTWPDVLVGSYGRRWNKLLINNKGKFVNESLKLGYTSDAVGISNFRGNGNSFGPTCADADNDGRIDIFQNEITHLWAGSESDKSAILWNEFPKPFIRVDRLPRPANFENQGDIGAHWGDLDNDGLQDLMISNSDYPPETKLILLKQTSKRVMQDVSATLGEQFINGKGSVFVDFDLDGDLDILSSSSAMRGNEKPFVRIYKNSVMEKNPKLKFVEIILKPNRAGIPQYPVGSRVTVTTPQGAKYVRELSGGYGAEYTLHETLHFGLGAIEAEEVDVEVTWTNGTKTTSKAKVNRTTIVI